MVSVETFYLCFSADRGSAGGFIFIQYSSDDIFWQPKYLDTLFLKSPHICFSKDLVFDLFVARNDSLS